MIIIPIRNFLLILLGCFLLTRVAAQRIYGTAYSEKGDLLPYVSVLIKGTTINTMANADAKYMMQVSAGNYTIVCQYPGYKMQTKNVTLTRISDEEVSFVMLPLRLNIPNESANEASDPAASYIANCIKGRAAYLRTLLSIANDNYEKKSLFLFKKGYVAPLLFSLSEQSGEIVRNNRDKYVQKISGCRIINGEGERILPVMPEINLYENNVRVFKDANGQRGIISPLAGNASRYYKFRLIGYFYEEGQEIASIQVMPMKEYIPLFSGIINVVKNNWQIHSCMLLPTAGARPGLLNNFILRQQYIPYTDSLWVAGSQYIEMQFGSIASGVSANCVNVYSNYRHIQSFPGGYSRYTRIFFDNLSTQRDKFYWDSARNVLPDSGEINIMKTAASDDPAAFFEGYSYPSKNIATFAYDWLLNIPGKKFIPLPGNKHLSVQPLFQSSGYNFAEGAFVGTALAYTHGLKKNSYYISATPSIRYGFANGHLNASLDLQIQANSSGTKGQFVKNTCGISFGKNVFQFNKESSVSPMLSSISAFLYGKNYMKTYECGFFRVDIKRHTAGGLTFGASAAYENRIPLNNTIDYTFRDKYREDITPNYPTEKMNVQFDAHQALLVTIHASYQPGTEYAVVSGKRFMLGSAYPLLGISYTKGVKGFAGSDVDFDKWKLDIAGDRNCRLAGKLQYKISLGGFTNKRTVYLQDYQHFNGNQSLIAGEYLNGFQAAGYYANSTIAPFYVFANVEHHFNGWGTNILPLLQKWDWYLVAGTNMLYVNRECNHIEVFAGLENIFQLFRLDVVMALENGAYKETALRLGLSGSPHWKPGR